MFNMPKFDQGKKENAKQLPDCSSVAGLQICVQHWGDDQHILVNFLILEGGMIPKKPMFFYSPWDLQPYSVDKYFNNYYIYNNW